MTEYNSSVNYEKHFLVNCLKLNNKLLPMDICNTIKDYLFYDTDTSRKILFVRQQKRGIVTYFEENMRFYNSVSCCKCGDFQMTILKNGVETCLQNIVPSIKCKCNEYSMWLQGTIE